MQRSGKRGIRVQNWTPVSCKVALALGSLLLIVTTLPGLADAQYIYLDSDGDGISSAGDVLNLPGVPTQVSIYLDTSHNRDGSDAFCSTGPEALTINSYTFILHAEGGTVTYQNFTNLQPSMSTLLGTRSSDTDFYVGRGGGAILDPGLYHLGTISVTVASEAPSLGIAQSTQLGGYRTSFGTQCAGQGQDNTYKLGSDWFDADGAQPPDVPPAINAPTAVMAEEGQDVALVVDAVDSLSQVAPTITAVGYPAALTFSTSQVGVNSSRATLSGRLGTGDAGNYTISWTATDDHDLSATRETEMNVVQSSQTSAGASIVGYTTSGPNVVVSNGGNGIDVSLGTWGTVWPYAFCQEGNPCTEVTNRIDVDIDVQTGGTLSFSFEFMQYGTPYLGDALHAYIEQGQGPGKNLLEYFGNPQSCWGALWQNARRTITVDLSQWPNRHVNLVFRVNDCYGHGTDALALIRSIAIRECSVTPLAPLSASDKATFDDHPNTPVEAGLSNAMQSALGCLRTKVDSVGGVLTVTSAYRTPSYQAHLRELYDKRGLLAKELSPDCDSLRAEINDHIGHHSMQTLRIRPAGPAGPHTRGLAFDANWSNVTNIDGLACLCGLFRPFKVDDAPHFVLRPCQ